MPSASAVRQRRPPAPSASAVRPWITSTVSKNLTINLGYGTWNVPATLVEEAMGTPSYEPWGHPAMARECVRPGCRGFTETVPSGLLDGHRYSVSTLRK